MIGNDLRKRDDPGKHKAGITMHRHVTITRLLVGVAVFLIPALLWYQWKLTKATIEFEAVISVANAKRDLDTELENQAVTLDLRRGQYGLRHSSLHRVLMQSSSLLDLPKNDSELVVFLRDRMTPGFRCALPDRAQTLVVEVVEHRHGVPQHVINRDVYRRDLQGGMRYHVSFQMRMMSEIKASAAEGVLTCQIQPEDMVATEPDVMFEFPVLTEVTEMPDQLRNTGAYELQAYFDKNCIHVPKSLFKSSNRILKSPGRNPLLAEFTWPAVYDEFAVGETTDLRVIAYIENESAGSTDAIQRSVTMPDRQSENERIGGRDIRTDQEAK